MKPQNKAALEELANAKPNDIVPKGYPLTHMQAISQTLLELDSRLTQLIDALSKPQTSTDYLSEL